MVCVLFLPLINNVHVYWHFSDNSWQLYWQPNAMFLINTSYSSFCRWSSGSTQGCNQKFILGVFFLVPSVLSFLSFERGSIPLGLVLELQYPSLALCLRHTIFWIRRIILTGQNPHGLWRCYLRWQNGWRKWNTSISDRVMGLFWLWFLRRDRGSRAPGTKITHPHKCDLQWPEWPINQWRVYNNSNNFNLPI